VASWETDKQLPTDLPGVQLFKRGDNVVEVLATCEGAFVRVQVYESSVNAWATAGSAEATRAALAKFVELLPAVEAKGGLVPVTFWTDSEHGAQRYMRKLKVPNWGEIRPNYAGDVQSELDELMSDQFKPAKGGQLVLWHGEPGTGKTYALRALAKEWAPWCKFEYIVDPENFFGQADYMTEVLLRGHTDDEESSEAEVTPYLLKQRRERAKWRLLVLEDTGELLAADAKQRTGQALSRFLNVVDGFIGQGLQVLVMVTTNEPLREMHQAVSRPGRCASALEFVRLSAEEADQWARDRGRPGPARSKPKTVAELFGLLEGQKVRRRSQVGFRPGGGQDSDIPVLLAHAREEADRRLGSGGGQT
jgi:hypothetical protein